MHPWRRIRDSILPWCKNTIKNRPTRRKFEPAYFYRIMSDWPWPIGARICGVFALGRIILQFGNNGVLSDCTGYGELTYNLVIIVADDEGRTDVSLLILKIYVLAEMISGELFAVYYIAVVI